MDVASLDSVEGAHEATFLCRPAATGHGEGRGIRPSGLARADCVRPRQPRTIALAVVRRRHYGQNFSAPA